MHASAQPTHLSSSGSPLPLRWAEEGTKKTDLQPGVTKARVTADNVTKPPSLLTRFIEVVTARSFRAQSALRQATKTVDQHLSKVIEAVNTGDRNALRPHGTLTAPLGPFNKGNKFGPSDFELRGSCILNKVLGMSEIDLTSLNDNLKKLPIQARQEPVLAHLEFAVRAALLDARAHAIEGEWRSASEGKGELSMRTLSISALRELSDMVTPVVEFTQVLEGYAPQHAATPGTQLTAQRLQDIETLALDAETELAKREVMLADAASNLSLISTKEIGELKRLRDETVEWLLQDEVSTPRPLLEMMLRVVLARIEFVEDKINE